MKQTNKTRNSIKTCNSVRIYLADLSGCQIEHESLERAWQTKPSDIDINKNKQKGKGKKEKERKGKERKEKEKKGKNAPQLHPQNVSCMVPELRLQSSIDPWPDHGEDEW